MAPSSPSPPLLPLADPSGLLATPATRAAQACQGCRKRKARCINFVDGSCQLCREKGVPCEMAPNMAKDRAALSRARNEENELLRQQMGPEAVMSLLQGSGIDAEAALLRLGRPEGRVGGNGPAGSLEDVKRVCHQTDGSSEFLPNSIDSRLLAHLLTDTPDSATSGAYDEHGFDADGRWAWTSGTVPPAESFDKASDGGLQWLPTKAECETHVDFYFEHLHPLMPMLSETWVRHWLGLLWDEAGERVWRGWSSWSYDATDAESANLESRSPLPQHSTQITNFIPVLFAVMSCAASAASGGSDHSAQYHTLAIRSMQLSAIHSASTVSGPQLYQIQVMALLSNHLASLGHLPGAWRALKYGARLLQERGLHLSANHGHGIEAEIRRRTFWCIFNLDRALGRILGKPFQVVLPLLGGSMLPLAVDESSELWASYFEDGKLLPASYDQSTAQIFGFVLLCRLADLAARVVKDLFPPERDRSQDWRLTGVRTMLESALEGWLEELSLIEHDIRQTFGDDDDVDDIDDEHVDAVEMAVRNLALDVRLLIYRVQLPRSSQRGTQATNSFSLEPQIAAAQHVVAVPVAAQLAVPRSIYTVQATVTVYLSLFPLLYQQLDVSSGEIGRIDSAGRHIRLGLTCLETLATAWPGTTPFAESAADLAQLVAATARRFAGPSTTVRKGKKKAPPKLKDIAKGKDLPKVDSSSAGFPLIPPEMVNMTLDSPQPSLHLISPRSAARYQPYPQSPPGQLHAPLRLKPDPRKKMSAGRQRSKTVGAGDANPGQPFSRARPPPKPRHPRAAQPTSLVDDDFSDDDAFSPSGKDPRTPPGLVSAADWSSQDEQSPKRGRTPGRQRYSAPLSPTLPPQPLGYDDDSDGYDMDDDEGNLHDTGDGGFLPTATYAIPPLQHPVPSSSAGLSTPLLKESPVIPASFPGYDRFAASLAYDRSRQQQQQQTSATYAAGPWEVSTGSDAYYRPVVSSASSYRAPGPPPAVSQGSLPLAFAHYAPFPSSQGGAIDAHPTYGSYDASESLFYSAESPLRPPAAFTSFGQHAHPSVLQYHPSQRGHHRRR